MASILLFTFPRRMFFGPNTIAFQYGRDPSLFCNLTGTCHYNNGPGNIPGAFDGDANQTKVCLPKPLLTGADRKPNAHGWCVGDLAKYGTASGTYGTGVFDQGQLIQLYQDDGSTAPYWQAVGDDTHGTLPNRHYAQYKNVHRIPYPSVLDELIVPQNVQGLPTPATTATTAPTQEQEESLMQPFTTGDKVVSNGFRYNRGSGRGFRYGTNDTMLRWENEKAVLTVRRTGEDRVYAGPARTPGVADVPPAYSYHPSELRAATPEEVAASEMTAATPPTFPQQGSMIRHRGHVYMVCGSTPDGDGDLPIRAVDSSAPGKPYLCVNPVRERTVDDFTIIGRMMDDGDFRPVAAEPSTDATDPLTWKAGTRVKLITELQPYLTTGGVYILEQAPKRVAGKIVVTLNDDDGDSTERLASHFVLA